MRKFLPNNTRFFKLSEIAKITNDNVENFYNFFKNIFLEGYFSEENPNSVLKTKILTINAKSYLGVYVEKDKKFLLLNNDGLSNIKGGELVRQTVFFDDVNPANGSSLNKIKLKDKSLYIENNFEYSTIYSSENFYCLQLNGTYQENINILMETINDDVNFGFTKIKAGAIQPAPVKLNGSFAKNLVESSLIYVDFLSDFCGGDKNNCVLVFPYLNTEATDKILILEVTNSTNNKTYYHIPKDVPIYTHNAFFINLESEVYKIKISLGDITINSNDKVNVYFASQAIPQEFVRQGTELFINKYKLQNLQNLAPETTLSLVLLALDELSGTLFDLQKLNTISLGNNIDIDLPSGTVEIALSLLPYPSSKVFFTNAYYTPPIQNYKGLDYVNNLTIYGYPGNLKEITIGNTYNVYVKNIRNYDIVNSIINSFSQVENVFSSYVFIPKFAIAQPLSTEITEEYTNVGTIFTSLPNSANLVINTGFTTPFQRLQTIANNGINKSWKNFSIIKNNLDSGLSNVLVIPIIPIPYLQKLSIKGFSFMGNVVSNSGPTVPVDFKIKFNILQNNVSVASIIFPTTLNYNTSTSPVIYEMNNLVNNSSFLSYQNNNSLFLYTFQVEFLLQQPAILNIETFNIFYEMS